MVFRFKKVCNTTRKYSLSDSDIRCHGNGLLCDFVINIMSSLQLYWWLYVYYLQLLHLRFLFKMPLFSSKFAPKTIPVRKQDTSVVKTEFGSDYASKELSLHLGPLKMKLGDFELSYEDGQWIPGTHA